MEIYRFRPFCRFREEIEGKSIYFPDKQQLNDPMEGVVSIFWKGNFDSWMSLFKHYFSYLRKIINESLFDTEHGRFKNFPTDQHKNSFFNIEISENERELFLKNKEVQEFAKFLVDKEIDENFLHYVFCILGLFIIGIIQKINGDDIRNNLGLPKYLNYEGKKINKYFFVDFETIREGFISSQLKCLEKNIDTSSISTQNSHFFEVALLQILLKKASPIDRKIFPHIIAFHYISFIKEFTQDNYGILCFSKSYSNVLMWSHYADSHKGVSLIFNSKLLVQDFPDSFEFFDINYNNEYIKRNWFDLLNSTTSSKFFTHKVTDWSYEKEYRVLGKKGLISYNFNALSGLIFGCQFDKNNILEIIRLLYEIKGETIISNNFKLYKSEFCKKSCTIKKQEVPFIELGKYVSQFINSHFG